MEVSSIILICFGCLALIVGIGLAIDYCYLSPPSLARRITLLRLFTALEVPSQDAAQAHARTSWEYRLDRLVYALQSDHTGHAKLLRDNHNSLESIGLPAYLESQYHAELLLSESLFRDNARNWAWHTIGGLALAVFTAVVLAAISPSCA
jgi:hypothetical protein